jgi:glycosyltransferase involved in cell wall biosynthesis
MTPTRILVESIVDEDLTNAQMVNAREIIRRLDPDRFHVTTFMERKPDPEISGRPNTKLIRLSARRKSARILKEFVVGKHDVLFYVKASPASRWYMKIRSAWRNHCTTVGTIESQCNWRHEPTITPDNVAMLEQTVLRCDHLFSNSKSVKRSLQNEYGLQSGIVATGVDTSFFVPDCYKLPNSRPRVLFVGSLRPFKGPQVVVSAAERFPQADFVIVGDGVMAEQLRQQAQRLANLRFAGALSRSAVRDEYRRADIFLFPSRWEGSPKVILEAAACGVPVIARHDYEPETVLNGQTGYLISNEDELFSRLDHLLQNAVVREAMGRAGRMHILNFDWDCITRQWEEIFINLAANCRHAS